MSLTIAEESPLTEDLALLFARHTAFCHADTPPESIHMMDRASLVHPDIRFFVARRDGAPLAMGAIKLIEPGHGEIKSMHVLDEARGHGLARAILTHLLAQARAAGLARLSLETGAQPSFAAARALYEAAGFAPCPPFKGYGPDPMSAFLTIRL